MSTINKDGTELIFTASYVKNFRPEDAKRIEAELNERTGLKCLIYGNWLITGYDIKFSYLDASPKQLKEPAEEPREVLNKEPANEGHEGNDRLHKQNSVLAFCKAGLRLGTFFLAVAAFFFLGCLTAFLLKF